MWCGMLGLSLSSITMAFSPNIGLLLGDPDDAALLAETALPETGSGAAHALPPAELGELLNGELEATLSEGGGYHPAALWVAIASFWAADFFLNALQGPARTLVVDMSPPHQQAHGASIPGNILPDKSAAEIPPCSSRDSSRDPAEMRAEVAAPPGARQQHVFGLGLARQGLGLLLRLARLVVLLCARRNQPTRRCARASGPSRPLRRLPRHLRLLNRCDGGDAARQPAELCRAATPSARTGDAADGQSATAADRLAAADPVDAAEPLH